MVAHGQEILNKKMTRLYYTLKSYLNNNNTNRKENRFNHGSKMQKRQCESSCEKRVWIQAIDLAYFFVLFHKNY